MTAAQRRLRAQIAAHSRWAKENPAANAARGQAGLMARFEREVDPNGVLPLTERYRRAESARLAHMKKLALASAGARAARKARSAAKQ
jgi:hypothetical protein